MGLVERTIMKFCELTETEFDTFSKEVSCKNFFQSLETLKRYKNNKEEVYLVGVKDNDKVVAASILVAYKESKYFLIFIIFICHIRCICCSRIFINTDPVILNLQPGIDRIGI